MRAITTKRGHFRAIIATLCGILTLAAGAVAGFAPTAAAAATGTFTVTTSSGSTSVTTSPGTATATPGSPITLFFTPPTSISGVVVFQVNGSPACTASAKLTATVSCTASFSVINGGTYTLSATYFTPSPTPTPSITLTGVAAQTSASTATTIALASSSILSGQTVNATATVSSSGGTPSGTVQFEVNGQPTGSPAAVNATGTATATLSGFSQAGTYQVTAIFTPSSSAFAPSSSDVPLTVSAPPSKHSTSTVFAVSPVSIVAGDSVALKATVTEVGTVNAPPDGDVTFTAVNGPLAGQGYVAEQPLASGGVAQTSKGGWLQGVYTIQASYGGGANDKSSNATATLTVKANTTTKVSASTSSTVAGQQVTFTAQVDVVAPGTGVPPGTVSFTDGGAAIAGCTNVPVDASGAATCATSALGSGTHSVVATYSGATLYNPSSSTGSPASVAVVAGTTTQVSASPTAPVAGQTVALSVTVAAVAPATSTPTGTVNLTDNGSPIAGCTNLSLSASGTASCSTSALAVGSHNVVASYAGATSQFNASTSSAVVVTVSKAPTTSPLTVVANPATMTYGGAVPSFTVTFTGFASGDTSAVVSGSPSCTTTASSSSPVGTYPITCTVGTLSAKNYTFAKFVPGTLTVDPAPLTVAAKDATMLEGATVPPFSATITGFASGDTSAVVSGSPSCTTTASSSSPVGTYPITCTVGTLSAKNYTFSTFTPGKLTVQLPKPTITSGPSGSISSPSATIAFSDAAQGVTYACSIDGGSYSTCSSPATYTGLTNGNHTFSVVAVASNGDQSDPATISWTVQNVEVCTGVHNGSLWVGDGQTLILECIQNGDVHVGKDATLDIEGATVHGHVSVDQGSTLDMESSTIDGGVRTYKAASVRSCKMTVLGSVAVMGTSGDVTIGDGTTSCTGTFVNGSIGVNWNAGAVTFVGNAVDGSASFCGNVNPVTFSNDTFSGSVACGPGSSGQGSGGDNGNGNGSGDQGSSGQSQGNGNGNGNGQGSSGNGQGQSQGNGDSQGSSGSDQGFTMKTDYAFTNYWLYGDL